MRKSYKKVQSAENVTHIVKNKKTELLKFVFCFSLFVLYALRFASVASAEPPSPFAGDNLINVQAPEFTLNNLDGKAVSLASYRGTVVLLNFWATWCPSCREEMPSMNKLARQFKNRNFSIIAVATDRSSSDVRNYLKKNPSDFTVLVDEGLSVSRSKYKVFVLPMSFLIDKKGVIVEKYFGGEDWTDPGMIGKIEGLMTR